MVYGTSGVRVFSPCFGSLGTGEFLAVSCVFVGLWWPSSIMVQWIFSHHFIYLYICLSFWNYNLDYHMKTYFHNCFSTFLGYIYNETKSPTLICLLLNFWVSGSFRVEVLFGSQVIRVRAIFVELYKLNLCVQEMLKGLLELRMLLLKGR